MISKKGIYDFSVANPTTVEIDLSEFSAVSRNKLQNIVIDHSECETEQQFVKKLVERAIKYGSCFLWDENFIPTNPAFHKDETIPSHLQPPMTQSS